VKDRRKPHLTITGSILLANSIVEALTQSKSLDYTQMVGDDIHWNRVVDSKDVTYVFSPPHTNILFIQNARQESQCWCPMSRQGRAQIIKLVTTGFSESNQSVVPLAFEQRMYLISDTRTRTTKSTHSPWAWHWLSITLSVSQSLHCQGVIR
jgi:hypothetical protein